MPTILSRADGGRLQRLTTRNRVSLLTGSISRFAKIAAGLPPSARPRWWTIPSPARASRRWRQHPFGKALREDLPPAQDSVATKAASDYYELDPPSRQRKVPDPAPITAMNAARHAPARWTKTKNLRVPDGDNGPVSIANALSTTNPAGTRLERRSACCMAPILRDGAPRESQTASNLSQSPYCMPIHTVCALAAS